MRGTILLLDDEVWVSLTVAEILADHGYEIAGPFKTNAAALAYLATNTPDAAILDYQLVDGRSNETASRLIDIGVPVIVASGFARSVAADPEYENAMWLEKPFGETALLNALHAAFLQTTHFSAA